MIDPKDLKNLNDIIEGVEPSSILDDELIDPCKNCECCGNCGEGCTCEECDCK